LARLRLGERLIEGKIYKMGIICIVSMIKKTITIREEQEKWIQNNHLNLSRFVQDKLDDVMEEREDG